MKYEGEAIEKMGELMYRVGSWVAVRYGIEKVLELEDLSIFKTMLNEYHEAMAQAILRPEFRKECARRTYETLQL